MRSKDGGRGGRARAAKTSCLKTSANWMREAKAELEHVPFSKVREEAVTRELLSYITLRISDFSARKSKVAKAVPSSPIAFVHVLL